MDTIKINKGNAKMVAHRGLSGLETENTASAFVAAGNRSYFGMECDIHPTRDKEFVVIHDFTTERVCDTNITVEESNFFDLRKLVLKDRSGAGDIADMKIARGDIIIPTLEEYIAICKKYSKVSVLEIKGPFSKADLQAVVSIIKGLDWLENVIFISFDFDNCVNLRNMLPDAKVQYLVCEYNEEILNKLLMHKLDIDIYYKALTKENISQMHANNITVNCWTVDDKDVAEQLASWGVDFITSNILE